MRQLWTVLCLAGPSGLLAVPPVDEDSKPRLGQFWYVIVLCSHDFMDVELCHLPKTLGAGTAVDHVTEHSVFNSWQYLHKSLDVSSHLFSGYLELFHRV
jgi:hypothetical protein